MNRLSIAVLLQICRCSTLPEILSGQNSFSSYSFGVIAIALGAVFLFFGQKILKKILILAGFAAGAFFAYFIVANLEAREVVSIGNRDLVIPIVSIIGGALGAGLVAWIWKIGIFFLGGLAGFGVSMFLLSWKSKGVIEAKVGRSLFIVISVAIGVLLMVLFQDHVVVFATSIFGGMLVISGIDVFLQSGFNQMVISFITNVGDIETSGKLYGLLVSAVFLIGIGTFVQFKYTGNVRFK